MQMRRQSASARRPKKSSCACRRSLMKVVMRIDRSKRVRASPRPGMDIFRDHEGCGVVVVVVLGWRERRLGESR
jgi:hypothetical protein